MDSASMTDATEATSPYAGVQYVAIPEFQAIGIAVGQQMSAALSGKVTVEQALSTSQTLADREMRKSRSEEHTSELQSQSNLVCRLLLEKKKDKVGAHRMAKRLSSNDGQLPGDASAIETTNPRDRSTRRDGPCTRRDVSPHLDAHARPRL